MIRFNFLPWRERERRRQKHLFQRQLLLSGLLGMTLVIVVWIANEAQLQRQADRNDLLTKEIRVLDQRLQEIAGLKRDIEMLLARRQSVAALQSGRHESVHLLQQLAEQVPEGVMLKSLSQAERIQLTGYAVSNSRVSELLRHLDPERTGLQTTQPELVEIKSASLGEGRDVRKVFEFTIMLPPVRAAKTP